MAKTGGSGGGGRGAGGRASGGGGRGGAAAAAGPVKLRLHHALAEVGLASRRACEQAIMDGKVFVNGKRVDRLPACVNPNEDRVVVAGREVSLRALVREGARGEVGPRRWYVMVNKPERYLTSTADVEGEIRGSERKTVMDLVKMPGMGRLVPVGRLEFHASGLVLLTNDGELVNRLTHARYGVSKTYRVWVRGGLDEAGARSLSEKVDKMCVRMAKRAGAPLRAGASIATVELASWRESAGVNVNVKASVNVKGSGAGAGGDARGEVRGERGERSERGARGGRVVGRGVSARVIEDRASAAEADAEGDGEDGASAGGRGAGAGAGGSGVGEVDLRTGKRLGGAKTAIDITLRGAAGKLKLPAMLTYLGLRIDKIMQVAIGDVELRDVAVGQWRPLTVQEIKSLKRSSRAPVGLAPLVQKPRQESASVARGPADRAEGGAAARGTLSAQERGIERERARQGVLAERAAVEMASGWGEELSALDVDVNAGGEGRFVDERARMSARGRAEAKARQEHRPEDGSAAGGDEEASEAPQAGARVAREKAKAEATRGPLIKRFGSARRGGGGGEGGSAGKDGGGAAGVGGAEGEEAGA